MNSTGFGHISFEYISDIVIIERPGHIAGPGYSGITCKDKDIVIVSVGRVAVLCENQFLPLMASNRCEYLVYTSKATCSTSE